MIDYLILTSRRPCANYIKTKFINIYKKGRYDKILKIRDCLLFIKAY